MRIKSEQRRLADEEAESDRLLAQRRQAYLKWKDKLDSRRPSEREMETWLNCDKTIFLDEVLRRYRLAWHDIIAYAFLQTPADNYSRARVPGGPWRYSRYSLRLFLITQDGVREVDTELDFATSSRDGLARNNYRFDAVSSIQVNETSELAYTLDITLMNGPTNSFRIVDQNDFKSTSEENPTTLSEINLDASGFGHALHILEGIAAKGNWVNRELTPSTT
ncbi:hypothetical protein [Alloactinosynnema sp. L-07]|uniref:hypothetical protein n=1 Tax=Alloactinosynnema sp. L-07 TaxID=1653480 RepID=UPI00065F073C|nr:hypothetical protein [Alloactinosynnema sp. L-07]CRK58194.1 hypothetical protein [Alloactinosynnema sp. L-07]